MRVLCVIEHGKAPSTRLRLTDCDNLYRKAGVEIRVVTTRRSSLRERTNVIRQARRHDIVVLFKTISFSRMELGLLQRSNPRIVFDFDDAVMFREQKHRQPLNGKNFRKFLRTMKRCAAAVAGNNFLACFAEACGCPATVLPTAVDLAKYPMKTHGTGAGLTIGWLGLSDGLQYLQYIQPALQQLSERFPKLKVKVVSDKPLQLEGTVIENTPWRLESEQASLASFDIGIMPLWDSVWTRGKCGYKILQYMAAGLPVVASAVGANVDIITDGVNGFLARTQEEWVNNLARLIENPALRRDFGQRGRELAEKKYSIERFAEGYIKLFQKLTNKSTSHVNA